MSNEKMNDEPAASVEKYLGMKEHEKDAEIQKAVARLQKRIQELLYAQKKEQHPITTRQGETTEPAD